MSKIVLFLLLYGFTFAVDINEIKWQELKPMINSSRTNTIIVVATPWCRIYKQTAKAIKESTIQSSTKVYFVNTEKSPEIRKELNIRARPTILLFGMDGKLFDKRIGGLTKDGFEKMIKDDGM